MTLNVLQKIQHFHILNTMTIVLAIQQHKENQNINSMQDNSYKSKYFQSHSDCLEKITSCIYSQFPNYSYWKTADICGWSTFERS